MTRISCYWHNTMNVKLSVEKTFLIQAKLRHSNLRISNPFGGMIQKAQVNFNSKVVGWATTLVL